MTETDGPAYTELIPRPDPSKLTDAAIERATVQYRRELDAIRQLLAERIQTEIEARNAAVNALRDVWASLHGVLDQRITDQGDSLDRHLAHVDEITSRIKADQQEDMAQLREVFDTRLEGMDRATALLADDMKQVPSILEERLRGLRELIGERIDGIDKATTLKLAETDKLPAAVTAQIDQLRKLHEERFSSIAQQFAERDVRTSQAQQASDQALNAALQAAKELVNAQGEASSAAAVKSETSFTKQIDQIGTIISTLEKALDARITELKERIDRGEGSQSGAASVSGSPYESAVLKQAEQVAADARQAAVAAQSRALMATAISVAAVLAAIVSIVVLALKK